jgi:hypothetical protein
MAQGMRASDRTAPERSAAAVQRAARTLARRVSWLLPGAALLLAALGSCDRLRPDPRWREALRRARPASAPSVGVEPLRWVRRFSLPPGYPQGCDLVSTPSGLVLAASTDALTVDGAVVLRARGSHLETLLRWEGQGFLRVHAVGDTLWVPDADAPFHVLSFLTDLDVDGYVFVSDPAGNLTRQGRELLPAVYHVFDIAWLRDGRSVASTGAYFPPRIPYISQGAPAALFVDDGPGAPWRRLCATPEEVTAGVFRYTFLEALPEGALLTGVESPAGAGAVRFEDPTRGCQHSVVQGLDGHVLRWASEAGEVFVVTQGPAATALGRSTDGGRSFRPVPGAPASPQSLTHTAEGWHLLAGGALWRLGEGGTFTRRAPSIQGLEHTPSALVSAPLVVHEGRFWAASTRTGELYQAVPDDTPTTDDSRP